MGIQKKQSFPSRLLAEVTIRYHRPVNGREGKIWGRVVHKGFIDQGFGNRKPSPWRAGANENTVIEFNDNVKVEGQIYKKANTGYFIAYDSLESTLIFSHKCSGWGSFYDEKDDALRVKVKPQPLEKTVENLRYEFWVRIGQFRCRFSSMGEVIDTLQDRSGLFETTNGCVY